MNFTAVKSGLVNCFRPETERTLLPISVNVSLPAGLDWVVKQRLTSVILGTLRNAPTTSLRVDDLCRLDKLLSQQNDVHQVKLYGYELATLYTFLMEQQQSFNQWAPALVSSRARVTIQAQLRSTLPHLRTLARQVDCYADRPVHAC